jgi:DNA gyrase/topoisomerase IV subunit B
MKTFLLLLLLAIPASAQIEELLKKGANVTLKDQALVFVPVAFEPCKLVWQMKHNNVITRETTVTLADLDPDRIRVEPLKDEPGILQLVLYTLNGRQLITEQSIYRDNSRSDLNHKSTHVLLIKGRSTADKLVGAFSSSASKCAEKNSAPT